MNDAGYFDSYFTRYLPRYFTCYLSRNSDRSLCRPLLRNKHRPRPRSLPSSYPLHRPSCSPGYFARCFVTNVRSFSESNKEGSRTHGVSSAYLRVICRLPDASSAKFLDNVACSG
jgi:hypothetical protein